MRRIPSIDQRCQQHVVAASQSTTLRDQALAQASGMLQDDDTTRAPMDAIEVVQLHHLHKMQEQATTATRSLGGTAILAERASKQVKQLDFLLSRVTQTREIAHALQQQSANIQRISGAIEANDLEAATECVQRYEEAKRLLSSMRTDSTPSVAPSTSPKNEGNGQSSPDEDSGDVVVVDREAIMQSAKSEVAKLVRSQLVSAISMNDKLKIVKLTAMLSALGFRDESCEAYTSWICDHTIAQLKVMVSRELRNMDDPTAAGMSHLTLVSNALDHVVAAMEQEQPHVTEAFGPEGHLKLLQLLHSRCTHHCVPVVKDFLEKRKVPNRRSARSAAAASPERPNKSTSPPPNASASPSPLDPRKIDECLEDISHLVSCCSLYMSFIENEMAKAVGAAAASSGQRTESVRRAQYLALATKDNALFDTIQELLSIYIPLQSEYFEAAFQQAVKLQQSLLRGGGSSAGGRHGQTSSHNKGPSTSGQTFMGALTSLYGANEEDPDGEDAAQQEHNPHELPPISVVDDVFYFVRIAIHRAAGTKSTSILSAIIIAVIELIQSKLLGEITNHIQAQLKKMPTIPHSGSSASLPGGSASSAGIHHADGSAGSFATHHANIPAKALAWLCAAKQCQLYTSKIAEELHRLVMDHFPQPDEMIRFGEQRHDIDLLSKSVDETVSQWAGKVAAITAQGWMHKAGERFIATSYVVDDAQFYQFDLADPWAIAATVGWGHALDFLARCVTQDSVRELLVVEICTRVVRIFEDLVCKKKYSAYGALQLDKDVRTVRQFFVERTERPVRELFGRLHAIASILLVDRPQEVSAMYCADAASPSAVVLSVEDKRRFLSMRTEFEFAEIANVTS